MNAAAAMPKRVAILQSSYIPWKGYFDIIDRVDEFILFDDVQFTRRDWRSRNRIKTAQGPLWLTIPVASKGRFTQTIEETEIAGAWAEKHWAALRHAYARAPHFPGLAPRIEALYSAAARERRLSEVNRLLIDGICGLLGITTPRTWSRDYAVAGAKTERLVALCRAAGATVYLSGPSAQAYLRPEMFETAGVTLEWMDYAGYPPYPQLHGEFEHGVSILDLLFSVGPDARRYMQRAAASGLISSPSDRTPA